MDSGSDLERLMTPPDKVGAGLAPDKETEMRIRAQLEEKWALEKKSKEEEKKKKRLKRSIV